MAKQITFSYENKEYTLEYTRKSVEKLEARGFVITDVEKKPMSMIPKLFHGAFLQHQPWVKQELTDKILDNISKKEDLLAKLTEMYSDPIIALLEADNQQEGNVEWGASW